jgi:hypothetical protein
MNQNDWANTCSWPHWFMLLMLLFLAIPMSIKDGNFARIRLEGWIAALFTLRWAIAAFRRERTRNWIFYCLLGILLEPAIRGTAQWLMKD